MVPRPAVLLAMLALASVATGCRSARLAYDNADLLLFLEVRRNVCPDDAMANAIRADLRGLMAWHRAEELPGFVALLNEAAAALDAPITEAALDALWRRADAAWSRLLSRLLGIAERHVGRLASDQLRCLRRSSGRRLAEVRDLLRKPDAEYTRAQVDRTAAWLDGWVGDLDDAQRKRLGALYGADKRRHLALYEARREASRRLMRALAGPPAGRLAMLRHLRRDRYHHYGPARGVALAAERRARKNLLAVLGMLSAAQRAHLAARLRELATELGTLASSR